MAMGDPDEKAATAVIGAAIEVHRVLGPGYLESVSEQAMAIELDLLGIGFQPQFVFPLEYKGQRIGDGRLDFLVEGCLILELKAVDALAAIHTTQVVSYLKATRHHPGPLINFNVPVLTAGLKRGIL